MTQAETIERIIGRAIVKVRYMTVKEAKEMGWDFVAPVLVLDDGTQLFPSSDSEGNEAGALFGRTADESDIWLCSRDSSSGTTR